ncbi:MAG: hypothetical protein ACR2FO_02350 [Actinomycetota bacterium]
MLPEEQQRAHSPQARNAAASKGLSGKGPSELSEANLGDRVSILYRIHGNADYPFSEVVGVVQRVERGGPRPIYQVCRRTGELVPVPADDVVKLRLLGPRAPR